jgi:hypothetical protein
VIRRLGRHASPLDLEPDSPQNAAGIRIEPAPSDAEATPTMPAATAAALPPLDPPGLRCGFHGLRVAPHVFDSVKPQIASSGKFDLPTITAPAARIRATIAESAAAGTSQAPVPSMVTSPSRLASSSLSAMGTPCSGPSSPRAMRSSAAAASATARSAKTVRNAFSRGSSSSIRRR